MFQDWQLVHVAFKSFDLNLVMAHTAIFLKRVCHQTVCDSWHTATCMNCHSTKSTKNLAQKVSPELLKLNKLLFSMEGVSLTGHPYDIIGTSPNVAEVFPILNLDVNYFIHYYPLFLVIPFNIDHNSAIYSIIYNKTLKYFNITLFPLVTLPSIYKR